MNNIKIVCQEESIYLNKELLPQPMSNYYPDWYKNINTVSTDINKPILSKISKNKTVKSCISFLDIFNTGYYIPAPMDYYLSVDSNGQWSWKTPISYDNENRSTVSIHDNDQFVNHLPRQNNIKQVFKLNMPYYIIADKGINVNMLPMPYSFNKDWHINYGVIKADIVHDINIFLNYTSSNNEILIKQGTPLGIILPYKRNKNNLHISYIEEDKKSKDIITKSKYNFWGKFNNQYFRTHQKRLG